MDMRTATGLLLLSVALAGCTGGDDTGPTAEEQCALDDRLWDGATCTDHTEPHIVLTGLNETLSAYVTYPFIWALDNGTRISDHAEVHSMYSAIQAVTDGTVPTNTTDAEVAPVGPDVAIRTHQNLPVTLDGSFTWQTPESVVLWGYMRIDGENVWQQLQTINVIVPPATGVTHDVTIAVDPAAGGVTVTGDEVIMALGDGIIFTNDAPYAYDIDLSPCGLQTLSVAGQTSSPAVVFFAPLLCEWTGSSPLSQSGVADPGEISGSIRVRAE